MGLLDILNGMQNGPRGQSTSAPAGSGGMSPITMALMGLLAYKAIKHLSPGQTNTGTTSPNVTIPASTSGGGLGGLLSGGLGGLLQGPLGGLLAGGAAGSVLSGGLNDLLKQFQQSGQGDVAQSWVGQGGESAARDFRAATLPAHFATAGDPAESLKSALEDLQQRASRAVDEGNSILVVTDRGVSPHHVPIPSLLAVAAVHHGLIREGKRVRVGTRAGTPSR